MAVGIRLKFADGTQQQYEAVHQKMDIDGNPPEGLIFHSAGPIDGGWGVIDFWESAGWIRSLAESRLMPAVGELGDQAFSGPPDRKEFPVHNFTKP